MQMLDMLLVALAMASVVSVGLLFLPAIVELKKPRDAGPRLIADVLGQNRSSIKTSLINIEDESKLDFQLDDIEDYPCAIKNMKA
jgi:hypothetical protein